ncbi:MAG: signal peptidase I [Halanaeroarchaeum sp.]
MTPDIDGRDVLHGLALLFLLVVVIPFVVIGVPQVVGAEHSFVVTSGSMEPAISAGDVVIVGAVSPSAIQVGDVITFEDDGELTTHQVVAIQEGEAGPRFETKGTANENVDPGTVPADAVVGRVSVTIPYAGYVVLFANTKYGGLLFLGVPGVLLVVSELYELFRARHRTEPSDGETR